MAGKVKHMKRSRRSYVGTGYSVFRDFERVAAMKTTAKKNKKDAFGLIAGARALLQRNQGK